MDRRDYYTNFDNAINNSNFSTTEMESELSTAFESASTCSSFDSSSSSRSTSSSISSYSLCKRNGRRGGIQLKSHGANFTVKDGQWTLWVDTLPQEEMNIYKEAFAMYDRKGKGLISTRHLGSLMRNLGQNPQEQELSDILDEFTNGKRGHISFPEFVTIMAQKRQTSEQHIRDALNALDKDGDGLVSFKELAKDLSTIGACLKPDEINEIFADLEIDEDGNLSHDDLVDMVTSHPKVFEAPIEDDEYYRTNNNNPKKSKRSSKEYSVTNALMSFFGT